MKRIKKIIFVSIFISLTAAGSASALTRKNKIFRSSIAGKLLDIIMELLAGGIF